MKDYDIKSIFEQLELELIASMKRNLSRHQKWESDEGMNWTMWQAEQLKTLEEFKKNNRQIFTKKFTSVNDEIAKFLEQNYKTSGFAQERAILKELAKGSTFNQTTSKGLEGAFFSFNENKMNALIKATTKDMSKAEYAMLRMVNDQYRKTIFKAQVMANSGAFTLQQSIDMATKDFLKAGINCIEYKDGRRVNIASYAEMNIRTATKRAKLISEGEARKAYGIHTVRISRYGQCSETCLPWQGKVYVDDVYSGGTKEEAERLNLPLLSVAIAGGLFHPNCKHTMTTYFYDLKKSLGKLQEDGIENPPEEQEHRKNQMHIQQQERLATGALDSQNIAQAEQGKAIWEEKDRELGYENDDLFIFDFSNKKKRIHNDVNVIEKYIAASSIEGNDNLISIVKKEYEMLPEKALEFISENLKIKCSSNGIYYDGSLKTIFMNPLIEDEGILAHELGHAFVDTNDLYKKDELKEIMIDVLKNSEIKSKKYNGESYITLKSNVFIRPYQGRTYIKTTDFINNDIKLKYTDIEEYISVGYETFVTNPQLLYNKDRKLYDFFAKGAIYNG